MNTFSLWSMHVFIYYIRRLVESVLRLWSPTCSLAAANYFGRVTGHCQLGFVQEYLCTLLPKALKHQTMHET